MPSATTPMPAVKARIVTRVPRVLIDNASSNVSRCRYSGEKDKIRAKGGGWDERKEACKHF